MTKRLTDNQLSHLIIDWKNSVHYSSIIWLCRKAIAADRALGATPAPAQPDPLHVANERGEGEDAKDAARYRFLRDSDGLDEEIAGLNQCHWDKVIDAAMAAAPKEKP